MQPTTRPTLFKAKPLSPSLFGETVDIQATKR